MFFFSNTIDNKYLPSRTFFVYYKAMESRMRLGFILIATMVFFACNDFTEHPVNLTSQSTAAAEGPNCASCHGYPLKDRNHQFHVGNNLDNGKIKGAMTCVDCHSQSILFVDKTIYDTAYQDTATGERYLTSEYLKSNPNNKNGIPIRSLLLVKIDTLPIHDPRVLPLRAGFDPKKDSLPNPLYEYMTGISHMNGKIDVTFDARVTDRVKFNGQTPSYNPTLETCSAIACHPGIYPYRFSSASKGFTQLNGEKPEGL